MINFIKASSHDKHIFSVLETQTERSLNTVSSLGDQQAAFEGIA